MKMADFGFRRGVNLGGWLSQCDYSRERMDHFITEKDFDTIASWGLDHVRLPVDYNVFETESGAYLEDGFRRVEQALAWARARGLKLVLDLHKTCGFSFDNGERQTGFFDSPALQDRFCRLWEEFARRFYDPENVAFELLNEVTDRDYIGRWNRIAGDCVARIRPLAPDALILIGSYWNNSAEAVKDLDAPADSRVIYNFHCYAPMPFTHQGAYWVDSLDRSVRISFAESGTTEAYFEELFASAIEAAEKNGTCLYCGEYGVIEEATPEDTVRWYRTIHAVLERHGISRAAWSYRQMNFGLSDPRLDGVREELIPLL